MVGRPPTRRVPRVRSHSPRPVARQAPADSPSKKIRSGGTGVLASASVSPRPTSISATTVTDAAEATAVQRRDAATSSACGTAAYGSAGPLRPASLASIETVCPHGNKWPEGCKGHPPISPVEARPVFAVDGPRAGDGASRTTGPRQDGRLVPRGVASRGLPDGGGPDGLCGPEPSCGRPSTRRGRTGW